MARTDLLGAMRATIGAFIACIYRNESAATQRIEESRRLLHALRYALQMLNVQGV